MTLKLFVHFDFTSTSRQGQTDNFPKDSPSIFENFDSVSCLPVSLLKAPMCMQTVCNEGNNNLLRNTANKSKNTQTTSFIRTRLSQIKLRDEKRKNNWGVPTYHITTRGSDRVRLGTNPKYGSHWTESLIAT